MNAGERRLVEETIARLQLMLDADKPIRTAATTRANTCTCDRCGDNIRGMNWIGEYCTASIECPGQYYLDPEPVTFKDGRTLEVTVNGLAMSQAAMDAAADDFMGADLDPD